MSGASENPSSQTDAGHASESHDVRIPPIGLAGILQIPKNAYALVAFAHGSGSSRLSPRNTIVARALNDRGIATLLFDLLTPAEEADRANVFNIPLLADRDGGIDPWRPRFPTGESRPDIACSSAADTACQRRGRRRQLPGGHD
jgi:hypothetical protein